MKGTTTVAEGSGSHDARWPKSFKILESALKFRASVDSDPRKLLEVKCAGPSGFGPPVSYEGLNNYLCIFLGGGGGRRDRGTFMYYVTPLSFQACTATMELEELEELEKLETAIF